uniref:Glycosyltransferase family 92 protein n=1 Tax=Caenorhabditis tropicalis TaxID=1561998 RepID=A0A1I7U197_9PELO
MLIRHFIPHVVFLSCLTLVSVSVPYLSIWHFVDHRRYGAFPEEDHISLAYILGGNFMTRLMFMQHFKSVLNYSDHFFRLHFIVDDENKEDVNDLMTSWNISNCEWFFHNLTKYEDRVKWIPNSHYSKYYGLTKLLIPEIIGENVGKVTLLS